MGNEPNLARLLNETCACQAIDPVLLDQAWSGRLDEALRNGLPASHPHLVSAAPVYVSKRDLLAMLRTVHAVEKISRLPGWQAEAHRPFQDGIFMGYDFHLSPDGPQLIEINTNAGGAFVNLAMAGALSPCCEGMETQKNAIPRAAAQRILAMFCEACRQAGGGRLARVVILDEAPERQYLYPEFQLAAHLLRQAGIEAEIAAPGDLSLRGGALVLGAKPVRFIYNRLTDFSLSDPAHASLRDAWVQGRVILSPSPDIHARLADKRKLALFSDPDHLRSIGAPARDIATLARHVPKTVAVRTDNATNLWAGRNELYFKPVAGHAGKAVYRGAKLTARTWDSIVAGDYVAQRTVPPPARTVAVSGQAEPSKFDVRLYAWRTQPLLFAARIYQGQTTNFRTPGGGFAPVLIA